MASPQPDPQLAPALAQWSVDDVCRWAQAQPLIAAVAPVLRDHAVDGHVLVNYVTNAVLADELGIAAFGTRVHVLEAIEALRWSHGIRARPPPPRASHSPRLSSSPESAPSSKDESPDIDGAAPSKRSASRIADAEKKRQKRAALKKNPVLYAEYLQKERERNARRRARLRAERGRSDSGGAPNDAPSDAASKHAPGSSANDFAHATAAPPAYAPYAADPLPKQAVYIRHPLQPPPHNLRRGPDAAHPDAHVA
ncbi:hypothetical protein IWW55_004631 [Coemansia sp. RSA 2706]|nr:hypothetical protein LPJ63_000401 [Coemansia sp. RSA 2711]KAJ1849870.1 hypothetical protein LPJ70_000182 [Coemansia sp. RSA 2708]KAJ2297924.1 hypothetical protein IWW55_004631 [Coemansia sp. RSA 2706]KAJ2307790.1 hypothetical protein IWW54_004280 [Coemansia sp. RSA 2705]KAJ2319269.1 hypothetical protein IWW52_002070 [Coemansia sp. RSA 2704]KAJ2363463.1 hypothetical protein H4S01_004287 [Coemansia sp. RSA 2610]KAJ2383395.1 hypothetical protein H4S02_005319 [Coemansia sp. RSA 2611]KAJ273684